MKFVSEIEKYIRRDAGRMQEDARKEKKGHGRPLQLGGLGLPLSGMKNTSQTPQGFPRGGGEHGDTQKRCGKLE
ncbi:MAG: hypothetical protein QXD15_03945 [Thermoplasmata archaeon]